MRHLVVQVINDALQIVQLILAVMLIESTTSEYDSKLLTTAQSVYYEKADKVGWASFVSIPILFLGEFRLSFLVSMVLGLATMRTVRAGRESLFLNCCYIFGRKQ